MAFVELAADIAFIASSQKLGNQVIRRFEFEQHFAGLGIKYHKAFVFHRFQKRLQRTESNVFNDLWPLQTILRRQFKKEVVITPITGYCDEGADFPYPVLLRYYRLELDGHHLFLKLYAEPNGSPGMGEWGYTELEFYPKLDRQNLDDIKKNARCCR